MKKTSKFLALFMATLMPLSLVACSSSSTDQGSEKMKEEKLRLRSKQKLLMKLLALYSLKKVLSLKLWFDNETYNEKIVELWKAKYPNIPLTVENVGTTDARQKNELEGPTGEGADVFVVAHDGIAVSAQAGTILEIDKLSDEIRKSFC